MDDYDTRARLYPAVIVCLPLAFVAVASFPTSAAWWTAIVGLVTSGVLVELATQIGRTFGRRLQKDLFKQWGGAPTVALMRFHGSENPEIIRQRHQDVSAATGRKLPSAADEQRDPSAADIEYAAATDALRIRIREASIASVLRENLAFGLRRNMLGLRSLGAATSVAGIGAALVLLILGLTGHLEGSLAALLVATLIDGCLLVVWLLVVNEQWVREAGIAYGERLIEAAPSLPPSPAAG